MKVTVIYADWCNVCHSARKLWNELRKEYTFDYEEVSVTSPEGLEYVKKYAIHAVPVTLIEGRVAFLGMPERAKAVEAVRGS